MDLNRLAPQRMIMISETQPFPEFLEGDCTIGEQIALQLA